MAEEPVNNKTFKDLIAEQKKTTIAVEKSMMDAEQRAAFEAAENENLIEMLGTIGESILIVFRRI